MDVNIEDTQTPLVTPNDTLRGSQERLNEEEEEDDDQSQEGGGLYKCNYPGCSYETEKKGGVSIHFGRIHAKKPDDAFYS